MCVRISGSWACTRRWCWWSASLCVSSSAASRTPSCSRSCPTWTASLSCAPTFSWCGRRASWTWRRTCTPSSSSFTAPPRQWSSGPGKRRSERVFFVLFVFFYLPAFSWLFKHKFCWCCCLADEMTTFCDIVPCKKKKIPPQNAHARTSDKGFPQLMSTILLLWLEILEQGPVQ